MSYMMADIESDGPKPGDYFMICFGAVLVEPALAKTFYGQLRPVSDHWMSEALADVRPPPCEGGRWKSGHFG
jgi:hypothetical protein